MELTADIRNEIEKTRSFILGGNSEFSIENLITEKAYRYRVHQSDKNPNIFFVRVKISNEDEWIYAGFLNTDGNGTYNKGNKGSMYKESAPIKGLLYALRKGDNPLPRPMVIYHHGRCACCGKPLMDLVSTQRGFGPVCYQRLFGC